MQERTAALLQYPFSNTATDTAMAPIAVAIETGAQLLIDEENLLAPGKPTDLYLNEIR